MRIVHAADIHLDTPFRRHDAALRQRLQQAGREAFHALVDLTLEERADALVVAGDLFDNEWLTIATERVLTRELARLTEAEVTVVYATGNHDPGRTNYRAAHIDWPSTNFHLHSSRTPGRIPIYRGDVRVGWVVAAGHQTTHESTNLASTFPPAPGPQPVVALLHADVGGALGAPDDEAGNVYAPAALADLDPGYDYWALGHIHKRQRLREDSPAWYPGNLQGRDFGETGAKGALVVDLNPPQQPSVRFHPLASVRWERLTVSNLDEAHAIGDVHTAVRANFDGLRETDDALPGNEEWILRVELSGPCPLAALLRQDEERDGLAEYLCETLGALDVEVRDAGLFPPIDLSRHVGQRHVLGEALELIRQARLDDGLLSRLAPPELALGDEHAEEAERLEHLRGLLSGLDAAAAERLLRSDSA
ncbi:MAG: DNA repair exonuclease [Chloroflexota bacterium]|nr:DNA repair exonuclease [Chloroflexota bacterium]MDE2921176.1 DNA repair exonuclease [Chloroflexota bacterium]